jgi:hypothetical protein
MFNSVITHDSQSLNPQANETQALLMNLVQTLSKGSQ